MKKYLFGILLAIITMPSDAAWHIHALDGCAQDARFMARDYYHFCGAHEAKCNGDWAENTELENGFVTWYNHGAPASFNGTKYWCCGGLITGDPKSIRRKGSAKGTPGKWVEGDDFYIQKPTTKTKSVAGGTCSYTEWEDVCGNKFSSEGDCIEQIEEKITCPDGQYYRKSSKSCATLCKTGYAYESKESNRCVECAETSTQGIISATGDKTSINIEPKDRICKTCPASTSIFDPETRECVPKPQLTALTTTELLYGMNARTRNNKPVSSQCWTKFGKEYKDCVLSGYVSNNTSSVNNQTVASDTVFSGNKNNGGNSTNTTGDNTNKTSGSSTSSNTTSGNTTSGGGGGYNSFVSDPIIDKTVGGHKFNIQKKELDLR